IHESFVPAAEPAVVPASAAEWESQRNGWLEQLRTQVFRGWPALDSLAEPPIEQVFRGTAHGVRCTAWEFESQKHVPLRLYLLEPADAAQAELTAITLRPCDRPAWEEFMSTMQVAFPELIDEQSSAPAKADRYGKLFDLVIKQRI